MDIEKDLSSNELVEIVARAIAAPVTGAVLYSNLAMTILLRKQHEEAAKRSLEGLSIDEAGEKIGAVRSIGEQAKPSLWAFTKAEFHLLLCTDDPKYSDTRKALGTASGKSQTAIVSIISAAVALNAGMIAAALVPLCALCLLAVAKMGKNAFCDRLALFAPVVDVSTKKQEPRQAIAKSRKMAKKKPAKKR